MIDHEKIRAQVVLAAAGALNPDESLDAQRHLQGCVTCREEFDLWKVYAGGLRRLPQPSIPVGLLARTHAEILHQNTSRNSHRGDALMLVPFAVLSWLITFFTWMAFRLWTGGNLQVLGTNLVSPIPWFLAFSLITAVTAGTAALILSSRREARRIL